MLTPNEWSRLDAIIERALYATGPISTEDALAALRLLPDLVKQYKEQGDQAAAYRQALQTVAMKANNLMDPPAFHLGLSVVYEASSIRMICAQALQPTAGQSLLDELHQARERICSLEEALTDLAERAERARSLLHPRGEWNMLDTSRARQALQGKDQGIPSPKEGS